MKALLRSFWSMTTLTNLIFQHLTKCEKVPKSSDIISHHKLWWVVLLKNFFSKLFFIVQDCWLFWFKETLLRSKFSISANWRKMCWTFAKKRQKRALYEMCHFYLIWAIYFVSCNKSYFFKENTNAFLTADYSQVMYLLNEWSE